MANKKTTKMIDGKAVEVAKKGAKNLVLIKGEDTRHGYRVSVFGGIVKGIQVLFYATKNEATDWVMEWAYNFYTKRMGKRVSIAIA